MARVYTNGPARKLECAKHPSSGITLYGVPDAVAWCHCGRPMQPLKSLSKKSKS